MAQFLRPDGDVATGSWTATPLFEKIDEVTRADGDLITSSNNSSSDICEVSTSNASDPDVSTGHIFRYTYRKDAAGGHSINFRARLLQGATEIASFSHTAISETFVLAEQTLSGAQADSITDYNDLRFEFERSGDTGGPGGNRRSAETSWAELEIPDATTVVTPSPVTVPLLSIAPTVILGVLTLSPNPTTVPLVLPDVTLDFTKTLSPDAVTFGVVVPAPSIQLGAITKTPDAIAVPLVPTQPTVVYTVRPDAVTVPLVLATGTVIYQVNPGVVTVPLVVPVPVVDAGAGPQTLTPDALAMPISLTQPTVVFVLNQTPLTVPFVVPDPSITLGVLTVSPDPVTVTLVLPQASVQGLGGAYGLSINQVPPEFWTAPWVDKEGDVDQDGWRRIGVV